MNYSLVGQFPKTRLRRNRQFLWLRNMVAEFNVQNTDLIQPIFIRTSDIPSDIPSLPGIKRYTLDELPEIIQKIEHLGIPAIALFPVISSHLKDEFGKNAVDENNLLCTAVRKIKSLTQNLGIIVDVALDPYTTHGHDGLLINGVIDNDKTNKVLVKQALVLAAAGADIIAPSDMMDGRIQAIRTELDNNAFSNVSIMSYAAKFASAFYGPFRDAVCVKGLQGIGDKLTYQLDPRNYDQAMQEIAQDIQEGADMIIIKPGMPYLDIIQRTHENFNIPLIVYQVSGEYSMIKAAAQNGWVNEMNCFMETMYSFKRAGARSIITYAAMEIASFIHQTTY
jgi:porphobilinogen synthase